MAPGIVKTEVGTLRRIARNQEVWIKFSVEDLFANISKINDLNDIMVKECLDRESCKTFSDINNNELKKINQKVKLLNLSRNKRGLLDVGGVALKFMFGTLTESDKDSIIARIEHFSNKFDEVDDLTVKRISANFRKVLRVGLIKLNKTYYLVAIVPVLSTERFPNLKLTSVPKLTESKEFETFIQVENDVIITDKNYLGVLVEKNEKLKVECTILDKQYLCERTLRLDKQRSCALSICCGPQHYMK